MRNITYMKQFNFKFNRLFHTMTTDMLKISKKYSAQSLGTKHII